MARIGVLVFTDHVKKRAKRVGLHFDSFKYLGIRAVLKEIDREKHSVEFISSSDLNNYDFVLVPLHSFQEVFNLVKAVRPFKKKRKAKIVIGGQGVINVKAYLDYFDIAVFGRAEGQINGILEGAEFDNVLVVGKDPHLERKYSYRQPQFLVEGENNVGCRNKCYFCFYSWTHRLLKKVNRYNSTVYDECSTEDDIKALKITKPGHYITAIDGFSEESRLRVNKKITNSDIVEKIQEFLSLETRKKIFVKAYMIAGYPWEDPGNGYFEEIRSVLQKADKTKTNTQLILQFQVTPFSPEPLTPMQWARANFYTNWHKIIGTRLKFYFGKNITAVFTPFVRPSATNFEEVFLNRACIEDSWLLDRVLINPKFISLKNYKKILYLKEKGFLDKYETGEAEEWSYLSAGCDLSGFKEKFN
jgi:radical SAM superfamily enzyme YgiQ (UPF0313 family)